MNRAHFMTAYELFSLFDNLADDASIIAAIYEALQGVYTAGYDSGCEGYEAAFHDGWASAAEKQAQIDQQLYDADPIREPFLNANPEGFEYEAPSDGRIYAHSEGHDFGYDDVDDAIARAFLQDEDLFFSDDVSRSERTLDEVEDDIIVGTTRRYPDGPSR